MSVVCDETVYRQKCEEYRDGKNINRNVDKKECEIRGSVSMEQQLVC